MAGRGSVLLEVRACRERRARRARRSRQTTASCAANMSNDRVVRVKHAKRPRRAYVWGLPEGYHSALPWVVEVGQTVARCASNESCDLDDSHDSYDCTTWTTRTTCTTWTTWTTWGRNSWSRNCFGTGCAEFRQFRHAERNLCEFRPRPGQFRLGFGQFRLQTTEFRLRVARASRARWSRGAFRPPSPPLTCRKRPRRSCQASQTTASCASFASNDRVVRGKHVKRPRRARQTCQTTASRVRLGVTRGLP